MGGRREGFPSAPSSATMPPAHPLRTVSRNRRRARDRSSWRIRDDAKHGRLPRWTPAAVVAITLFGHGSERRWPCWALV